MCVFFFVYFFCSESEELRLIPVVSCFDLRIIFAPAIVYASKTGPSALVCGHSTEVNATSDIEFFISVDQLKLFKDISDSNVLCFMDSASTEQVPSVNPVFTSNTPITETLMFDSGIGSESVASTLWHPQGLTAVQKTNTDSGWSWLESAAFDMLLTAGRISLMLYLNAFTQSRNLGDPSHNLAAHGTLHGSSLHHQTQENVTDSSTRCAEIVPLLHATFSQPHSFVTCHTDNCKIELSCYDMSIRGPQTSSEHWTTNEDPKVVPELNDFPSHWIETRPGKVDPTTGIPSCLYTLKVDNYLSPSGISFSATLYRLMI
jgi:vacuolar protein sorting-associated protein 13B